MMQWCTTLKALELLILYDAGALQAASWVMNTTLSAPLKRKVRMMLMLLLVLLLALRCSGCLY